MCVYLLLFLGILGFDMDVNGTISTFLEPFLNTTLFGISSWSRNTSVSGATLLFGPQTCTDAQFQGGFRCVDVVSPGSSLRTAIVINATGTLTNWWQFNLSAVYAGNQKWTPATSNFGFLPAISDTGTSGLVFPENIFPGLRNALNLVNISSSKSNLESCPFFEFDKVPSLIVELQSSGGPEVFNISFPASDLVSFRSTCAAQSPNCCKYYANISFNKEGRWAILGTTLFSRYFVGAVRPTLLQSQSRFGIGLSSLVDDGIGKILGSSDTSCLCSW